MDAGCVCLLPRSFHLFPPAAALWHLEVCSWLESTFCAICPVSHILHTTTLQLFLDLVPHLLVRFLGLIVARAVSVLLQSFLKRSLQGILNASCVTENSTNDHHNERCKDENEVGAKHAFTLLHSAETAKEGDDDVGGRRVEADVKLALKIRHH